MILIFILYICSNIFICLLSGNVDLLEDANEVQEILGRSYGINDDIEDADLDAELDALADELEGEELEVEDAKPAYLQPSSLPVQPNTAPISPSAATSTPAQAVDEYGLPTHA